MPSEASNRAAKVTAIVNWLWKKFPASDVQRFSESDWLLVAQGAKTRPPSSTSQGMVIAQLKSKERLAAMTPAELEYELFGRMEDE